MRVENLTVPAGISLAALILASGCTGEAPGPIPDTPTPPATAETASPYRDMPYDPCLPLATLGKKEQAREARDCDRAMSNGRIALVGYGLKPAVLGRLAKDVTHELAQASQGAVSIKVVPVRASSAAAANLDAVSPKCIDIGDVYKWGSYTANNTEPSLDKYNYVVGATTKPSCRGSGDFKAAKGVADSTQVNGRFVELMSAKTKLPRKNRTRKIGPGVTEVENQQFDANVVAHELFHALGLGHGNEVVHTGSNNPLSEMGDRRQRVKKLNLLSHIKKGEFVEYGEVFNIMGNGEPDITGDYNADILLNPVQLAWLKQPDVILGQTKNPFVKLGTKPVKANGQSIYTVKLPRPLHPGDFAKGHFSQESDYGAAGVYDKVAITATLASEKRPTAFELYLLSSTNDTLFVDTVYDTYDSTWELGLGGQQLIMDFGRNATRFSTAKPNK